MAQVRKAKFIVAQIEAGLSPLEAEIAWSKELVRREQQKLKDLEKKSEQAQQKKHALAFDIMKLKKPTIAQNILTAIDENPDKSAQEIFEILESPDAPEVHHESEANRYDSTQLYA